MPEGYLAFHLHAHLPYVRHPEYASFLEERWFFDAITDTYVPLLSRFEQLRAEGIPYRLSMTLSPTLLGMFADHLLQERFYQHLQQQLELCDRELERTAGDAQFAPVVQMYSQRLGDVQRQWARFGGNLATAFSMLADQGHLELLTCAATHCFLPHQRNVPGAIERQLDAACELHERVLGRQADGIWLPECAYFPGLEEQLLRRGLLYFFVDTHALSLAQPRSLRGPFSHVYLPNGVAAFARDQESSKQVWSSKEGYPGDALYRDFYRDIGFDLPLENVANHIHLGDTRILTGFKYYAVTGETEHKEVYNPALAQAKAAEHARHFVWCREQQLNWLAPRLDRAPVIVSPYDAELFGHWWFEGPDFLYWTLRELAANPRLDSIAAKDYLSHYPSAQVVIPNASSWGDGGYYRFWLNERNEWVYPHLNAAGRRLEAVLARPGAAESPSGRQARRELLLAQCSDWPFIMSTGTSPGYSAARVERHLSYLRQLLDALERGEEAANLGEMEYRDNIF
jgi:1,4-alpha-glucan branching enzyme